jgi:hypothetical protein
VAAARPEQGAFTIDEDNGRCGTFHVQKSREGRTPTDRRKFRRSRFFAWRHEKLENGSASRWYAPIGFVAMLLSLASAAAVIVRGSLSGGRLDTQGSALGLLAVFT